MNRVFRRNDGESVYARIARAHDGLLIFPGQKTFRNIYPMTRIGTVTNVCVCVRHCFNRFSFLRIVCNDEIPNMMINSSVAFTVFFFLFFLFLVHFAEMLSIRFG